MLSWSKMTTQQRWLLGIGVGIVGVAIGGLLMAQGLSKKAQPTESIRSSQVARTKKSVPAIDRQALGIGMADSATLGWTKDGVPAYVVTTQHAGPHDKLAVRVSASSNQKAVPVKTPVAVSTTKAFGQNAKPLAKNRLAIDLNSIVAVSALKPGETLTLQLQFVDRSKVAGVMGASNHPVTKSLKLVANDAPVASTSSAATASPQAAASSVPAGTDAPTAAKSTLSMSDLQTQVKAKVAADPVAHQYITDVTAQATTGDQATLEQLVFVAPASQLDALQDSATKQKLWTALVKIGASFKPQLGNKQPSIAVISANVPVMTSDVKDPTQMDSN